MFTVAQKNRRHLPSISSIGEFTETTTDDNELRWSMMDDLDFVTSFPRSFLTIVYGQQRSKSTAAGGNCELCMSPSSYLLHGYIENRPVLLLLLGISFTGNSISIIAHWGWTLGYQVQCKWASTKAFAARRFRKERRRWGERGSSVRW